MENNTIQGKVKSFREHLELSTWHEKDNQSGWISYKESIIKSFADRTSNNEDIIS